MKRKKSRSAWYYALLILLIVIVVAATLSARYIKKTDKVVNNFTPADPTNPTVVEEFDREVKKDVSIEVGDPGYPVYVRVALVITWKDAEGYIYFNAPVKDKDYTIEFSFETDPDSGWEFSEDDGYYYYTIPVESGKATPVLITECTYADGVTPPEGYALSVDIITQTIQAIGYTDGDGIDPSTEIPAYKDAWGLS